MLHDSIDKRVPNYFSNGFDNRIFVHRKKNKHFKLQKSKVKGIYLPDWGCW